MPPTVELDVLRSFAYNCINAITNNILSMVRHPSLPQLFRSRFMSFPYFKITVFIAILVVAVSAVVWSSFVFAAENGRFDDTRYFTKTVRVFTGLLRQAPASAAEGFFPVNQALDPSRGIMPRMSPRMRLFKFRSTAGIYAYFTVNRSLEPASSSLLSTHIIPANLPWFRSQEFFISPFTAYTSHVDLYFAERAGSYKGTGLPYFRSDTSEEWSLHEYDVNLGAGTDTWELFTGEELLIPEFSRINSGADIVVSLSRDGKNKFYEISSSSGGGNVKIPISVPEFWKSKKKSRFLPDTIYIGTDINYFAIADDLKSWKYGGSGPPEDIRDVSSTWFDPNTGYIHFEWEFGR